MHQTSTTPRKPGLYCRLSKKEKTRGHEHLTIDRQESNGRQLGDRLGWGEPVVYVDDGHSAWSGARRPDFDRLIADVESGAIDGILVGAGHDRLVRLVEETVRLMPLFRRLELPVFAAWEAPLDCRTAAGRKQAIDMANAAEFESSRKSERTQDAKAQRAEMGTFSGGQRPFGFMDDGFTHHPTEAALLQRAAAEVIDGRSLNSIAVETGINRRTLHRALLSPRVRGRRVHRGEDFGPAAWEPILTEATQQQVRVALAHPARAPFRSGTSNKLANPLLGLLWSTDGRKLWSRPDHRHGTPQRRYKTMEGKPGISVTAVPLERFVSESLFAWLERHVEALPDTRAAEVAEVEAEIALLRAKLAKLKALLRSESIDLDDYVAEKAKVDAGLRAAEARMPPPEPIVEADLVDLSRNPAELRRRWDPSADDALTVVEQRQILRQHIHRVLITPAATLGGFDTQRVSIDWRTA